MNPEQWGEVRRIFQDAAELPPEEQIPFIEAASPNDPAVRAEVYRLLQSAASDADFLDTPAPDLLRFATWSEEGEQLATGQLLANRFEICSFRSRGGMGEVYFALDRELSEDVALKTIRPDIAADRRVIERFKGEVRHAREVSHPNICRVHELFCHDFADGRRLWFLTMERLDGPTLRERLRDQGPMPEAEVMEITRQIVDGLAAAHRAGLVHRDLKSSNVMLVPTEEGPPRAVITDFGIALRSNVGGRSQEGEIGGGTPGYMAPEQEAEGVVGPKADQYALGVVMCEMLTGLRPAWYVDPAGKRHLQLPDSDGLHSAVWEKVICRCLEFDPEKRFPEVTDVVQALAEPQRRRRRILTLAAVMLVIAVVGGVAWHHWAGEGCRICEVTRLTPETDESERPSLSHSGRAIAYSSDRASTGNLDIYRKALPRGRDIRLTSSSSRDDDPSLGPDGVTVAFRSERDGGGVYVTQAPGSERLVAPRGRNPQISPDGKKLLYWVGDPNGTMGLGKAYLMPLEGGTPVRLFANFLDVRYPRWNTDGDAILFTGCRRSDGQFPGCLEWWASSVDGSRIVNTHAMEHLRQENMVVSQEGSGYEWFRDQFIFSGMKDGVHSDLYALRLDPQRWEVTGAPRLLLEESARAFNPSVAANGEIAYTQLTGSLHMYRLDLAATQPAEPTKETDDADIDLTPFADSSGRWLVFARAHGPRRSIWRMDLLSGQEVQLSNTGKPEQSPLIDRSGEALVFEQTEGGAPSVYARLGHETPRRICEGCGRPTGWYEDGKSFFFRQGTPSRIRLADARSGVARDVIGDRRQSLSEANWSAATEFLAFTALEDDRRRVYAVAFPRSTGSATGAWIPLLDASLQADHPRWSGDGRTLYFVSNSDSFSCIYAVKFSPEQHRVLGQPYPVKHFHNLRASIDNVALRSFGLSASGDSLHFNLGEQTSIVWAGTLK